MSQRNVSRRHSKMKEMYETAELRIVSFEIDDVITTSIILGPYDTPIENP